MNYLMGEIIRKLRTKQNLTQEQLGEYLGVSSQAISKWENGSGFPDISMIPIIANYFCITIDELFGYHDERKKQIDEIILKIKTLDKQNNGKDVCCDECISLAREATAEFPGNTKIAHCLADVLYRAGYSKYGEYHLNDEDGFVIYDTKKHCKYAEWSEAIKIYEKILPEIHDSEERYDVLRNLSQLYASRGEYDNAIRICQRFSSISDCREIRLASVCDGKIGARYLGESVIELASKTSVQMIKSYIMNYKKISTTKAIEIIRYAINIYDSVFLEGDYGLYNEPLMYLYEYLSSFEWRNGEYDLAFKSLNKAVDCIRELKKYEGNSDITYKTPYLQKVKINPDGVENLVKDISLEDDFPGWCIPYYKDVLDEMKKDSRWDDLLNRIEEIKKSKC